MGIFRGEPFGYRLSANPFDESAEWQTMDVLASCSFRPTQHGDGIVTRNDTLGVIKLSAVP